MNHPFALGRGVATLAAGLGCLLILSVDSSVAQPADGRVSVGVAAGVALPYHGDFDFKGAAWQADVRVNTAPYFGFSVFVEQWRHTDEDTRTDLDLFGSSGPIGRVDRLTQRTVHRTTIAGWSFLGRGTAGPVTLNGGGGVSYLLYSRDFSQRLSGCTPASVCSDVEHQFSNGSFAAQLQGGVDVAVSRHIAAMVQFRAVVPIQDPGGGHNTLVGGIRVGL